MKNAAKFVAVVLASALVVLVVVLTSCGANYQKNLAGTYDLYEIQGDNGTTHEEIAQLEKAGFALFINLNEDGTFNFVYLGTDFKGSWSTKDGKSIEMAPEDTSVTMSDCTYEDGKLTLSLYGDTTVFAKGSTRKVSDYVEQ